MIPEIIPDNTHKVSCAFDLVSLSFGGEIDYRLKVSDLIKNGPYRLKYINGMS